MEVGLSRVGRAVIAAGLLSALSCGPRALASGMPPVGAIGHRELVAPTSMHMAEAAEEAAEDQAATGRIARMGQRYFLRLHHTHTGEDISIVYRIGDMYLPEALDRLNYFLRDHRTQDVGNYDPTEFDLLHTLMAKLRKPNGVIDIVCGYRTPESNEYLRTRSSVTGVAEHSQHILSKAIDIQIPGVQTLAIRNAALSLGAGGVGYYPSSHFVHVDVGPVREWQFGGRRVRLRTASARRHGSTRIHHRRG